MEMETEGVWVNEGDVEFWKYGGNLCRFSPDSQEQNRVDVLQVRTPYDTGDGYRAYLYSVDTDDLEGERLVEMLEVEGFLSRGDDGRLRISGEVAAQLGCGEEVDDENLAALKAAIGPARCASMFVDGFGANWDVPETYHGSDDGYNGPWRDAQDEALAPWGLLSEDELAGWMYALGAGRYVTGRHQDAAAHREGHVRHRRAM